MSEYFVPIFVFEEDAYNGTMVMAIEREDDTVRIHLHQKEEPLEYEFDNEDEAERKAAEAIVAWKKSVGATA